jgi:ribosomal 50S subunit-recycling heat shock protein
MRLDSFLSDTRLIKRRTQAKKACESGRVFLDGKVPKPGKEVKPGQLITINFAHRIFEVEVLEIPLRNVRKEEAKNFYKIIREETRKEELLSLLLIFERSLKTCLNNEA